MLDEYQYRQSRDNFLDEAQALLKAAERERRDLTDKESKRWNELMTEIRRLDLEWAEQPDIEAARERMPDVIKRRSWSRDGTDRDLSAATHTGDSWLPSRAEYRDVVQGSGDGGYLVPTQQLSTFFDRLRESSVLLSADPRVVNVTSDETRVPKIGESAEANCTAEGEQISTSKAQFERVKLQPRKLAALTFASNEVIDDSDPSAREVVEYDLTREMALELDKGLLTGDGQDNAPTGIRHAEDVTVTELGDLASLDDVAEAIGRVEDANASPTAIFMTSTQWNALRAEKDGQDRPLIAPDVTAEARRRLFGVPVFVTGHLQDDLIAADLRHCRRRSSPRRDDHYVERLPLRL